MAEKEVEANWKEIAKMFGDIGTDIEEFMKGLKELEKRIKEVEKAEKNK